MNDLPLIYRLKPPEIHPPTPQMGGFKKDIETNFRSPILEI